MPSECKVTVLDVWQPVTADECSAAIIHPFNWLSYCAGELLMIVTLLSLSAVLSLGGDTAIARHHHCRQPQQQQHQRRWRHKSSYTCMTGLQEKTTRFKLRHFSTRRLVLHFVNMSSTHGRCMIFSVRSTDGFYRHNHSENVAHSHRNDAVFTRRLRSVWTASVSSLDICC